jgi:outer membrane protein TolC
MRIVPTVALVAAATLSVACSMTSWPLARPQTLPGPQPTTKAAPQVAGRILTLEEAVGIALETQPSIQARLFDYAASRYRVDQALSRLLPQVTAAWSVSRAQITTTSVGPGGGTSVTSTQRDFGDTSRAQVALSQVLFDFGKTLAATEAQRKLAAVALEDIEVQRQFVALTVKEAYTNILFAQRLILVQQQALERAELNLRSARGFFEVGTRPRSDVARAEVDVANARVDLIRARNAEQLARVALNTAMGIDVDTPTQVQDNLAYEPVRFDRNEVRAEALSQRPEYRQAKLRVETADVVARQALRNFFPDLTGTGTYGGFRSTFEEEWAVTLSLTWTIADGGNRLAQLREARVNIEGFQARVQALELDILREVEQAQISVTEAAERIQAAQTAVASAQENFRLAQGRFDAGVGTILELTDAQLELTRAQNAETLALADYRISIYRLDRARGRR